MTPSKSALAALLALFSIIAGAGLADTALAAAPTPQAGTADYTLTVTKAGGGSGTITSNVGNIDCGMTTCSDTVGGGSAIVLTATPEVGSQFTGWLGPCTGTGTCEFPINGPTTAVATFAPAALGAPNLDIDRNGSFDALRDGLLIMRYLFGLSGASLIDGAVAPDAARDTAELIGDYLTDIRPVLDIDGNGQADALTDGLLVIRYLFGRRGDNLIGGVVGPDATRSAFADIEALLLGIGTAGTVPPPDPVTVAPPIDETVATTTFDATAFLYTGPDRIQTGVIPGTIDRLRVAVLRGRVLDRNDTALPGVAISVLDHPHFGQTLSRADGRFDMVVNGGGALTLRFARTGYISVQRQADVPWQDYRTIGDVVMTPFDTVVTTIAANAGAMQVHRGGVVNDADGTRRATLLFPAGTDASVVLADGSSQPLASLNVRATEFTFGPKGLLAMPAALPPTSGYTYAVELSVDEALAAGATRVDFSQPVINYVENFVGFPVGMAVPTGYYNRDRGAWVAAPNGRVIGITGVTGGFADVDTVGAGSLPAIVLDAAERQQLAALYPVGQTLWRVPVSHFTPWDHNWPVGPPADAIGPPRDPPRSTTGYDNACEAGGSIIDCESQTLGEKIGLGGTRFALRYRSDRVPARTAALEIPVTGPAVPSSLIEVRLQVEVAGTVHGQTFPPLPNQTATFVWDGLDAYGRPVQGAQRARVQIDFVYAPVYLAPSQWGQGFALPGDGIINDTARQTEVLISMTHFVDMARTDLRTLGLGGWALDVHHRYDPQQRTVRFGTGQVRRAQALGRTITRVDLGGFVPYQNRFAIGPDGSIYFITRVGAVGTHPQVHRRAPDGTVTVVAGNPATGTTRPYGDGGPALSATLLVPTALELGPDGSLYIADINVIRRVRPDGIIERFAGMRSGPDGGVGESCSGTITDGVPATQSRMCPAGSAVGDMLVGPDGSVYFTEQLGGYRLRRVGPDGIVTTVVGVSTSCYVFFAGATCGDGGPATQAELISSVNALALAPDGSLYLGDGPTIRRIGPDGIITRIANERGTGAFFGDGGPALQARLANTSGLAVEADGTIHVLDSGNERVRSIDPGGTIRTIAGTGQQCVAGQDCNSGDGGALGQARVWFLTAIERAPDASVYITVGPSLSTRRIRRIGAALPGVADFDVLIPSPDGGEVYQFDATGRHLRTRHPLTGAARLEFDYDADGRLSAVREMTGAADNVTTIMHDAAGNPTAVVNPFGEQTALAVDANGFLASIADPGGNAHQFAYTAGGLMTAHTDPRGNATAFTYDTDGLLTLDADPAGGSQALAHGELPTGFAVVRTTGLGLTTTYAVEAPTPGVERRRVIAADGTDTVGERRADAASATVTHADGTLTTLTSGPDPRFAMGAPIAASHKVRLPSALERLTTTTREATLAAPEDPFSLTSLTERNTVNGSQTMVTWNGGTRIFTFTSPEGRVRTVTLDALGRVAGFAGAGTAAATVEYDVRGRVARIVKGSGPAARETLFGFGANGRVSSVTDPAGRTLGFAYDTAGRRIATTRPDGAVVGFGWDAASNLIALTPPGRPAHGFAYDARDALASVAPPALPGTGPTLYATDNDGRLATVTRPDGDVVTLAYNAGGRLASRTLTRGGMPVGTWTTTYDAAGRVATLAAPGPVTVSYAWDGPLPLAETWTGAVAGAVARTWDARFRPASESVNGAHTVGFAWDGDGLLTGAGGLAITRNANTGLPAAATLGTITDSLTHDAFGAPSARAVAAGATPLYATSWERDALGRVTERRESVGADVEQIFAYAYDLLGRLVTVHRDGVLVETYGWDANGNRTSATVEGTTRAGTYDVQDRLVAFDATTHAFDPLGRLATATTGAATTHYRYDPLGNMAEVERPDGQRIGYLTDAMGRRVGRLVDDVLVTGFLYAGALRPVAELDGGGTVVSRFVYAGGIAPAYMVRGADTYRFLTDAIGSVRLVVNSATGVVAQRMDYDAFGNVRTDTNPGLQPFGFAGGLYDRDTGLVRMGARDYDPVTGRFTTRDPIGFAGRSTNLYSYAGGDPINASDPAGLDAGGWTSYGEGVAAPDEIRNASVPAGRDFHGDGATFLREEMCGGEGARWSPRNRRAADDPLANAISCEPGVTDARCVNDLQIIEFTMDPSLLFPELIRWLREDILGFPYDPRIERTLGGGGGVRG